MAICQRCGQNMKLSDTCIKTSIKYSDGKILDPIPYIDRDIEEIIEAFGTRDPVVNIFVDYIEEIKQKYHTGVHCHDCGVIEYGFHHPGCEAEVCPRCFGKVISCDCEII